MLTGRKLLLADDSVTIQKVVDLTFRDEGMQVTTVSDGEQALATLEELGPDIILADIHMPRMGGYQLCEQIKRDERFRHLPVMLLVGSFEPFDEEEARRVGADDHLTKPFQSIKQLVGKVSSLLGNPPQEEVADTQQLPPLAETEAHEAQAVQAGQTVRDTQDAPSAETLEVTTADTVPLPPPPHEEALPSEPQPEHTTEIMAYDPLGIESEAQQAATPPDQHAPQLDQQDAQQQQQPFMAQGLAETVEPARASAASAGSQLDFQGRDDALLDLGEIEPAYAPLQEDDLILDLQDEAFYRRPPTANAVQEEATLADALNVEVLTPVPEEASRFDEPTARAEEFTEAQLSGQELRADFASNWTAAQEQQEQPHDEFAAPAMFQEEERSDLAGSARSTEARTPRAGLIGLDQLSPEAIDAIARRAVELLSERAVQEIAWEVVPQLAELLIKRRLEEERTQAK